MTKRQLQDDEFLELITTFQPRIYAYLVSLAGNPDDANDILQETNVVLWREASKFEAGSNFKAWAFRVAHFEFMTHRQKRIRERLVFSDELIEILAVEAREVDELHDQRRQALSQCLRKLAPTLLEVVGLRYLNGLSVSDISVHINRTANAVSQLLFRSRKLLMECVKRSVKSAT